jgi:hypothetical protein
VAPATSGGGHGCNEEKRKRIFCFLVLAWVGLNPQLLKKKIHSGGVRAPIDQR